MAKKKFTFSVGSLHLQIFEPSFHYGNFDGDILSPLEDISPAGCGGQDDEIFTVSRTITIASYRLANFLDFFKLFGPYAPLALISMSDAAPRLLISHFFRVPIFE